MGAVDITMLGKFSNIALALRHPDDVVFAFHMTILSWSGYKLRGMVLSVVLCCCGSIPFKVEWAAHSQMPFSPPLLFGAVICLLACVLPVILEKSASVVQLFLSCRKTPSGNCKLFDVQTCWWLKNSLIPQPNNDWSWWLSAWVIHSNSVTVWIKSLFSHHCNKHAHVNINTWIYLLHDILQLLILFGNQRRGS